MIPTASSDAVGPQHPDHVPVEPAHVMCRQKYAEQKSHQA